MDPKPIELLLDLENTELILLFYLKLSTSEFRPYPSEVENTLLGAYLEGFDVMVDYLGIIFEDELLEIELDDYFSDFMLTGWS